MRITQEILNDFIKLGSHPKSEWTEKQKAFYEEWYDQAHRELAKLYPIGYYNPNPCQYRLTKKIAESLQFDANGVAMMKHRQAGAFWANGNGKTWFVPVLTGNIAWGPQNKWFNFPIFTDWPFHKHIRWVVDSTDMKEGGELQQAIEAWWPRHKYRSRKEDYSYDTYFEFLHDNGQPNGFILTIRTYDQPKRLHESASLGLVIFNEPPPESVYKAYAARLRHGGFRLILGTLVLESEWITEDIIENPEAVYEFADDEQNCKEHGRMATEHGEITGYLEHAHIENRRKDYDEDEREARSTGRPLHLRGRAFKLDENVHLVDRADVPKGLTHYSFTDPHDRRPWAILVGGIDANGDWWFVDEWPSIQDFGQHYHKVKIDHRGISDYAEVLKGFDSLYGIYERVLDCKFANTPKRGNDFARTLRSDLSNDHDLTFREGNPQVRGSGGGIRTLKQYMSFDPSRPIDFRNKPKLFIVRDLHNTIFSLRHCQWDEKADPDEYGQKETLEEKHLDFVRLLMYAVMHKAHFMEQETEKHHGNRPRRDVEKERRFLENHASEIPDAEDKIAAHELIYG